MNENGAKVTDSEAFSEERIRRGEWQLNELLASARALVCDSSAHESLYDGVRGRLEHLARSGAGIHEINEYHEAIARIGALAATRTTGSLDSSSKLSVRLEVLRHMAADIASQLRALSPDRLKSVPHAKNCLTLLIENKGEMERKALGSALEISESNLTRVLNLLERERLVKRRLSGQGAKKVVWITAEGRKALMKWNSPIIEQSDFSARSTLTIRQDPIPGVDDTSWSAARTRGVEETYSPEMEYA